MAKKYYIKDIDPIRLKQLIKLSIKGASDEDLTDTKLAEILRDYGEMEYLMAMKAIVKDSLNG